MSYGSSKWQKWVLEEEEAIKHIKYAYVSFNCLFAPLPLSQAGCQVRSWYHDIRHCQCEVRHLGT